MIVDVTRLPDEGLEYEGDEDTSILDLENDGMVRFLGPVHYALNASIVSNELIISGTIGVNLEFKCSRCSEFNPVFIEESAFLQAFQLEAETQSVDLTEDIREAMLLLFPAHPVCSAECKGLCPQCGMNYNKASCKCGKPADDRWGGLDDLKIEE